ncbi:MAG: hypothetical protein KDD55_05025 [Bdellovibrionales bacterium]|nr:hypothetical protein [Bdellovibrionales bacterium]
MKGPGGPGVKSWGGPNSYDCAIKTKDGRKYLALCPHHQWNPNSKYSELPFGKIIRAKVTITPGGKVPDNYEGATAGPYFPDAKKITDYNVVSDEQLTPNTCSDLLLVYDR